jgi:hypothetical protein
MDALFRFPAARRHDPKVKVWFDHGDPLRGLAERWFGRFRACGLDVRELIHDWRPTACVRDAAFAYVEAHAEHINIGFFFAAFLQDPAGLLEGTGKRMRHVKLRPGQKMDEAALDDLIKAAYYDVRRRLDEAGS